MKNCGQCNKSKPLDQFHRRGSSYQSLCKECRKIFDKGYYQENKEKIGANKAAYDKEFTSWYMGLKTGKPCTDCKKPYHPAAMQWDHLPGSHKIMDVSALRHIRSKKKILEEIAKCELVCANCHSIRTYERRLGIA